MIETEACQPLVDAAEGSRQSRRQRVHLRRDLLSQQPGDSGDDADDQQHRDQHGDPFGQTQMLRQGIGKGAHDRRHHHRAEEQHDNGTQLPREHGERGKADGDQCPANEPLLRWSAVSLHAPSAPVAAKRSGKP